MSPNATPEGCGRRARLIDAAAGVFVALGYAAATTDAIARAAGMSKKTLYQVFDSKIALFDAVIESRFFDLPIAEEPVGPDMAGTLSRLLHAMAAILLRPDRLALVRLIVSDGQATPELSRAFERLKVERDFTLLESWVCRHAGAGLLAVDDPRRAARMLFGMSVGEPMLAALIGAPCCGGDDPVGARIALAVRVFLDGLASDAGGDGSPVGSERGSAL